ncbi:mitochondrial inner membrane protein [Ceraceosorus bombacis]|uniref:MICOS complex subunit MIC60 n=1 Tax=Ceraceosorus bombacis TaxID=401625 RepID=A0A0P1BAI2_9BASI|nr:mitochondrial inner membrane protein [Ceraceosorus bombacis]
MASRLVASRPLRPNSSSTVLLRRPVQSAGIVNRLASTAPGAPDPQLKKKRVLPRLIWYSTLGLTLFYTGSTIAAINNDRAQDWYIEKVPLASTLLDLLESQGYADSVKSSTIDGVVRAGQNIAGASARAYSAARDKIEDLSGGGIAGSGDGSALQGAKQKAQESARQAKEQADEARTKAKEAAYKIERKVKSASQDAKAGAESTKESAGGLVDSLKSKADELVGRGKELAGQAEKETEKATSKVQKEGRGLLIKAKEASDKLVDDSQPLRGPIPLSHEAPAGYKATRTDRSLQAPTHDATSSRLREDPGAPKLPKLAPSLASLSGSEPMVGQLAATIDELAAFLKDTPAAASTTAKGVLDGAQKELKGLADRLETIKRTEAARVERSLADAAVRFDKDLARARDEATRKVGEVDSAWQKRQVDERKKQRSEFEAQLRKELDTQSAIINERLKEEVVAQGIEMQRSAVFAPLLFTRKGYVEGDDTPSTLARAQYWLDRRDLDAAAREVNSLKGWPKILAGDWLDAARARLEAQQALEIVGAQASFASLQVA